MIVTGCADAPISPPGGTEPALAKSGPSTQRVEFTINGAGMDVTGDNKGAYRDGVCGVLGTWSDILFLGPVGGRITKAEQASCAGIAPRSVTFTRSLRHVSDSPHIDELETPQAYSVQNIKFGFGAAQATTINSSAPCGTAGLRFTSITYPGSDFVVREDLGGGRWHLYTRPWPDNRAYCEHNGVVTFWHVSFDMHVQVIG